MTWSQRVTARGRRLGRLRWRLWRSHAWQIGQCAISAAVSWWVALTVLGHPQPFFAPVVAVVALGVSYAERLRRVGEVIAGAAVGVAVGDLFVRLAGPGTWQIAFVVALAMSAAVLLNAGAMLVTQAGVQGAIVTTLIPATEAGVERWLDAVVGGAVALAAAALVPSTPLRRPRRLAASLLDDLADVLLAGVNSHRSGDTARLERALQHARATQVLLDSLVEAAQEGRDVLQVSPLHRRHRAGVEDIWSIAEPLDRSARNVRVLLRRLASATSRSERVPGAVLALVEDLSSACALLAADLAADRSLDGAVAALDGVARASTRVPRSFLSSDVILAQVRSAVVDLFQVAGLEQDAALARMPRHGRE